MQIEQVLTYVFSRWPNWVFFRQNCFRNCHERYTGKKQIQTLHQYIRSQQALGTRAPTSLVGLSSYANASLQYATLYNVKIIALVNPST